MPFPYPWTIAQAFWSAGRTSLAFSVSGQLILKSGDVFG
jgi:hypothetical protein